MSQIRGSSQILDASINAAKLQASFNLPTAQLQDGALFIKSDGTVALAASLPMGGNKITGLGTPTNATDAATKGYVDGIAQGLDTKASVKVMSTTNLTLSGLQTVDGYTLVASDRILLTGQTTASQNGIWLAASGAWTRPTDYPAASTTAVTPGAYVFVEQGTTNADTGWVLTTDSTITVDTTSTSWTQFSSAGAITAGAGLTRTGNTLDIGAGNGIAVSADSIAVQADATAANITVGPGGISVTSGIFVLLSKLTTLSPQAVAGTVNGTNTVFTLGATPVAGTVCVFLNGQLQRPTTDYSISGSTITFVTAPLSTGTADWVSATFITA